MDGPAASIAGRQSRDRAGDGWTALLPAVMKLCWWDCPAGEQAVSSLLLLVRPLVLCLTFFVVSESQMLLHGDDTFHDVKRSKWLLALTMHKGNDCLAF